MPSYGYQPGDAEFPISFVPLFGVVAQQREKTQCEKESQFFKIRKTLDNPYPP